MPVVQPSSSITNYDRETRQAQRLPISTGHMSGAGQKAEAGKYTWRWWRRWWPHLGLDQTLQKRVELRQPPPRLLRRLAPRRLLLASLPRRREAYYLATGPPPPLTQGPRKKNRREPTSSSDGARRELDWQLHLFHLPGSVVVCVRWTERAGG